MPAKQARRWTITINNPSSDTVLLLQNVCSPYLPPDESGSVSSPQDNSSSQLQDAITPSVDNVKTSLWRDLVRYWISGREVAPTTGTPHLQCYMETLQKKTLTSMRKFLDQLGIKAHLTISDGTPTQNVLYCTKDNHDLLTYGTLSTVSQAKKKTAECVSEMIKNGAPLKRVAEEHPEYYMRSHRGIAALYAILKAPDDHDVPRDFKTEVRVYIGPTGTGKSREAHEKDQIQWTHPGDRWFDGYQGQERVLFDDFEGVTSGITYRKLLQITDRYPNPVPVKGGFANWRPRLIIFTTNVHPSKWYPDQDWPTIQRRIDEIRFFDP